MRARSRVIALAVTMMLGWSLTAGLLAVQKAGGSSDPVTGQWGSDGLTYLDLKLDAKSAVTGTAVWRSDGKEMARSDIKSGSFDPTTSALKLLGEVKRPDGTLAPFVIEGRIDKDTVSGTFKVGDQALEFSFKRL
jgi:hypothetical protein